MIHPALERPNTNNYFQFYGMDEVFDIDVAELKNHYLDKSKQYHPDFFGEDPQAQNIAVATSSFNNIAYKTLSNEIKRAQYLIELKLPSDAADIKLPQDFLMEIMELNESIDEQVDQNISKIQAELNAMKSETLNDIREKAKAKLWLDCQVAVLKWKYLERLELRIEE